MTCIPQNCYPYQQYSPFYPTTEQFLPEGVGTGMNMIYDIIYSLNVAPQKHPESLDLLYFLHQYWAGLGGNEDEQLAFAFFFHMWLGSSCLLLVHYCPDNRTINIVTFRRLPTSLLNYSMSSLIQKCNNQYRWQHQTAQNCVFEGTKQLLNKGKFFFLK